MIAFTVCKPSVWLKWIRLSTVDMDEAEKPKFTDEYRGCICVSEVRSGSERRMAQQQNSNSRTSAAAAMEKRKQGSSGGNVLVVVTISTQEIGISLDGAFGQKDNLSLKMFL